VHSRSRSSSISLLVTPRFGRRSGRSRANCRLVAVAVGTFWLLCGQARVAPAQIPGVAGGGIYGGIPQPGGPSAPTTSRAPREEIIDRGALAETKTFCVDQRNLEDWQAADVKEFLTEASEPGEVLNRLPWQLVGDCRKADAVARIYFVPAGLREEWAAASPAGSPATFRKSSQPVLLLYDKASIRLFYRAEGEVFRGSPVKGLAGPFATLAKDLKKIHGHT